MPRAFTCHSYVLVGPAVLPQGATYSIRGWEFILDWMKMRHVRSLHTTFFFFFFNAGTTVFSISFLKLKTGKLIKETNPFILNMLYNSGLWDQEMKWKSHLCHQACSSPWWVLLFTLCCWGFLTSCGFTFKSSNLTTYTCYVISGYLQGCFLIICRNS